MVMAMSKSQRLPQMLPPLQTLSCSEVRLPSTVLLTMLGSGFLLTVLLMTGMSIQYELKTKPGLCIETGRTQGLTSFESILASSRAFRMRLTIHLSASSGDMLSLSASMLIKQTHKTQVQHKARKRHKSSGKR